MYTLAELIAWILAVFGAANGIAFSALLEPIRFWLTWKKVEPYTLIDSNGVEKTYSIKERNPKWIGKLIRCPMCLGFWLGGVMSIFAFSPTRFLLGDMFLGSAVAWIIYLLIVDKQNSGSH